MTKTTSKISNEIEIFRDQANSVDQVLRINVTGLDHEDSMKQPRPDGNCLNWVIGHLLWTYNYNLPVLGQKPVIEEEALQRYARGTKALKNPDEALDFNELMNKWKDAVAAIDTALANLNTDDLDQPAKRTSGDESDESIRERITGILFHQSYHVGQTGLLRRLIGKDGAIE